MAVLCGVVCGCGVTLFCDMDVMWFGDRQLDLLGVIDLLYLAIITGGNSGVLISLLTFLALWGAALLCCYVLWRQPKRTETWYLRFRLLCVARVVITFTLYWVTLCIAILTSDNAWDANTGAGTGSYSGFFAAINSLPTADGHPRRALCYGVVTCFLALCVSEAVVLIRHGRSMEVSDELASQQLIRRLGTAPGGVQSGAEHPPPSNPLCAVLCCFDVGSARQYSDLTVRVPLLTLPCALQLTS